MGSTRERGVRGESLGDSREVGVLLKGGRGRTTLRAACLRVCMGGGRWRGKGETRLRNEQASENKVEARSRTSKKGEKQNIIFRQSFQKRVRVFQTPTGRAGSVQSPRCAPFLCRPTRAPRLGKLGFVFFVRSICQKGRGRSVVIRFRSRGGKTK